MAVDYSLIGQRIQKERLEKGTTQEHFAEYMDVSVGYVSQIERGITKISLDRLSIISDYLVCDMTSIITGSSYESENYLDNDLKRLFSTLTNDEKQMLFKLLTTYLQNKNP